MPAPPDDNHIPVDLIRRIGHRIYLRLIWHATGAPGASKSGPCHVSGATPYRHRILSYRPRDTRVAADPFPCQGVRYRRIRETARDLAVPGNGQVPVTVSSRRASMAVLPVRTA